MDFNRKIVSIAKYVVKFSWYIYYAEYILALAFSQVLVARVEVFAPQPNKTKPPLQVLAVAKGNSEKIKVWDEAHDVYIRLSFVW